MTMNYLKKAHKTTDIGETDVREVVQSIRAEIEEGGEATARAYAEKFDKWDGEIRLQKVVRQRGIQAVCQRLNGVRHG